MKLIASGWTQKHCWVRKWIYFLISKWNQYSTVSMKQDGPNSTSRLGNTYSAVCKRLGGYTREKEYLYIPGYPCFFPKPLVLDTAEKRCRTRRTFGLTLFLSSYFICRMLLNNLLSKKCVWNSRAHLFYLTTGVLTECLSPPHKLDTDTKGL